MAGATSLKAHYDQLSTDRAPYLNRGRDAARYTVPTLLPQAGRTAGQKLRNGFSNYGARLVNSLSAKVLLAGLPARQSFFVFQVEDKVLEQLGGKNLRSQVDKALASMESSILLDIETTATRTPLGEAIKHLIVAGNALAYLTPQGSLKVYPLHSYVCQRDGEGTVLKIITEDKVAPQTLPQSIRGAVMAKVLARSESPEKTVLIYTGVFREENSYRVYQEVEGVRVPGSEGTYPVDACPWMPMRWIPVDGESYGRGLVEDYLGYFVSLEALTAALVKGTAVAAKVVYLRNPNGVTKAAALTRSETGDVIDGKPDDVHALQSEKAQDFRTAREMINDLKEELAYAFAMNHAIQRNAERVTAEEIRYMAQDLDSALGGNFSTFSLEFQAPYLRAKMAQMRRAGKLPQLPKNTIRPVIVTGLDALGRGAELDNLRAFVKDVVELGGPQALDSNLYFSDLLSRLAVARGIKTDGLVKPEDVVAQENAAKQEAAMVERLGPNVINQAGALAKQGAAP